MCGGKLIVGLPHLLAENAPQRFRSSSIHGYSDGLVSCSFPIRYLLRVYASNQVIREAVEQLAHLHQASKEDEKNFS